MWSKPISSFLIFVSSFWTSFSSKFDHFIKSSFAQSSWWLRFIRFSSCSSWSFFFFLFAIFLFLFLLFSFSSTFRDPFFFGQRWFPSCFSIFIFLFEFRQEFLVFGFLFLNNFLLFTFGNNFKTFYHSFHLHKTGMLLSIDCKKLVEG